MDATNVTRQLTGFAARLILGAAMVAGGLLLNPLAASALFTQCPPVGLDTGCAVLIVFNPDGSRVTVTDPSQPPFDGTEDTLIGVQNNSGGDVGSLTVTGTPAPLVPNIGDFDGDGLCQPYVNKPRRPPAHGDRDGQEHGWQPRVGPDRSLHGDWRCQHDRLLHD